MFSFTVGAGGPPPEPGSSYRPDEPEPLEMGRASSTPTTYILFTRHTEIVYTTKLTSSSEHTHTRESFTLQSTLRAGHPTDQWVANCTGGHPGSHSTSHAKRCTSLALNREV